MKFIERINKKQRLHLLYDALNSASAPKTVNDAWTLIANELKTIEDAQTNVPYDFQYYGMGHRMFLPRLTNQLAWSMQGNWHIADLTNHLVKISTTGDIQIYRKNPSVLEFQK